MNYLFSSKSEKDDDDDTLLSASLHYQPYKIKSVDSIMSDISHVAKRMMSCERVDDDNDVSTIGFETLDDDFSQSRDDSCHNSRDKLDDLLTLEERIAANYASIEEYNNGSVMNSAVDDDESFGSGTLDEISNVNDSSISTNSQNGSCYNDCGQRVNSEKQISEENYASVKECSSKIIRKFTHDNSSMIDGNVPSDEPVRPEEQTASMVPYGNTNWSIIHDGSSVRALLLQEDEKTSSSRVDAFSRHGGECLKSVNGSTKNSSFMEEHSSSISRWMIDDVYDDNGIFDDSGNRIDDSYHASRDDKSLISDNNRSTGNYTFIDEHNSIIDNEYIDEILLDEAPSSLREEDFCYGGDARNVENYDYIDEESSSNSTGTLEMVVESDGDDGSSSVSEMSSDYSRDDKYSCVGEFSHESTNNNSIITEVPKLQSRTMLFHHHHYNNTGSKKIRTKIRQYFAKLNNRSSKRAI